MITAATQGSQDDGSDGWVAELLAEYAPKSLPEPVDPRLSLRDDLAIESLSLVSLVVRVYDRLGVDAASDDGLDLSGLSTVADLQRMARRLEARARAPGGGR